MIIESGSRYYVTAGENKHSVATQLQINNHAADIAVCYAVRDYTP
jgi:hypothetical protein